jgi:hypothetical protein
VTLTETPVGGDLFNGWGGACAPYRFAQTCTVMMSQAATVSADFYNFS